MLNEFRRLPPVARIFLVLMTLSVVLGVILLIAYGVQNHGKPAPKATTPNAIPTTSQTPDPNVTYTHAPSPLPTSVPTITPDHTNIANGSTANKDISEAEQAKAYTETLQGVKEWCKYQKGETESEHLKRVQPYFTSNAPEAQADKYIDLIQDQQCVINAGQPQQILSATHMKIVMYASIVSIYDGAKVIDGKQQSQLRSSNIYFDAYKVGGKWLIGELSAS